MARSWTLVVAAAAAAAFGACAGEDGGDGAVGAPGEPGGACTVEAGADGSAVITCPDGSSATVEPRGCTLEENGDGTSTLRCDDGTTVVIGEGGGVELGAGSIEGTAGVVGSGPVAGIEVSIAGTDLRVTTDAAGRYRFDGVPAGIHALEFARDPWVPQRVERVPVLPGTWSMEPVTLQIARHVAEGADVTGFFYGIDEDALVLATGQAGGDVPLLVELVELEDGSRRLLAEEQVIVQPYHHDDRYVIVRDADSQRLEIHDRQGGSHVLPDVLAHRQLPGGRLAVVEGLDSGLPLFAFVDVDTGERNAISNEVIALDGVAPGDETLLVRRSDGEHALFDSTTGALRVLPDPAGAAAWSEDGAFFAYLRRAGLDPELWLYDLEDDGDPTLVHAAVRGVNPLFLQGGRLVFLTATGSLALFDPASGATTTIATGAGLPSASESGRYVAFRPSGGTGSFVVWDSETGTSRTIGGTVSYLAFSPDESHVLWFDGADMARLVSLRDGGTFEIGQQLVQIGWIGSRLFFIWGSELAIFDPESGQRTSLGHGVMAAANPDDRHIVYVGTADGMPLAVYDTETEEVTPLAAYTNFFSFAGDSHVIFEDRGARPAQLVAYSLHDGSTAVLTTDPLVTLQAGRTKAMWRVMDEHLPMERTGIFWAPLP